VKLAEALSEYADTRHKLEQLRHQVLGAARHQEGEEPPESAGHLLGQHEGLLARRMWLITRINLTNAAVRLETGHTLTEALAERERLRALARIQGEVAERAAGADRHALSYRMTRGEIRDVVGAGLDVASLRRDASDTSAQIRRLDYLIQSAGMDADLLEES
jgi:hypothetical protein